MGDLARETRDKLDEAQQLFVTAISNNEAYVKELKEQTDKLTKGTSKPSLACGWDERWRWHKFLDRLVSDIESANAY